MKELQRLAIERACERLVIRYAHSIDLNGRSGLGDVFTDDAVVEMGGQVIHGRDAIAAGSGAAPAPLMRHVCTNILIDVINEAEATGVAYLMAYVQPADDTNLGLPLVLGEYRDTFRKTDDGWQIARRAFVPTLRRESTNS